MNTPATDYSVHTHAHTHTQLRMNGISRAKQSDGKILSNKSKYYTAPAFCNTVHTILHSTKMLLTRYFKDRPFLHEHITNASEKKKKKKKALGTKS